jgi:hypothetical protein
MISLDNIKSLEDLIVYGAVIGEMMDDDIVVAVSDTEKVLKYYPGRKLNLNVHDGMILPDKSALKKSMLQKKPINEVIPKEVYGTAFRSISNPIIDNTGKVIGGISISKSLEIQSELINSSETLTSSLQEISASVTSVAGNAQVLAESHMRVVSSAKEASDIMKETDEVLNFIRNISSQTNLLGLNAAIEAARAGENGRGFGVVAEEIRKLSTNSSEAVKKIYDILEKAVKAVNKISSELEHTSDATQEQAAATEEINASVEELTSISEVLITIGRKL